jgi:alkanesulfonate monooxygenase SsuD/methylene tetrahydromethanopterin reductase-like flavin-dependent oxidoreductase (luciferase family)
LPKPRDFGGPAMATATDNEPMLKLSAERGYALLTTFQEAPERVRAKTERYVKYASACGQRNPLRNITTSRLVYIAEFRRKAIEDLREAVSYEVSVQAQRGFLNTGRRFTTSIFPTTSARSMCWWRRAFTLWVTRNR